jgi:hypothetical protein
VESDASATPTPNVFVSWVRIISDADVKRVLTNQGWEAGRQTISGKQMRCWAKDVEKVFKLYQLGRADVQ